MRRLPALLLALAACGREAPRTARPALPVEVLRLETRDLNRRAALTGSAEPYREERLGFEVAGRVVYVVALGTEVDGFTVRTDDATRLPDEIATADARDYEVLPGDLIARLDDTRYRLRVEQLKAGIDSARKKQRAQEIDLKQVATADLESGARDQDAAEAALTLARTNLETARRLLRSGAGTQQAVDDAQSAYDQALARRQQTEAALTAKRATIELKQAQYEASVAEIAELERNLEQAERDLADCVLRAPFAGRITALHVTRGAIVAAGSPVATLTMMDPIKVSVAVSAETDRRLRRYERAECLIGDPLHPDAPRTSLYGVVIDKGEVGDAATRTFRIDVLVRNVRRATVPDDPALADVPVVEDVLPLIRRRPDEDSLYCGVRAVARDAEGAYVLHLKVPPMGQPAAPGLTRTSVIAVEKVRVVPSGDVFPAGRWFFLRLEDAGGLAEGDPLILVPPGTEAPDRRYGDGIVVGGQTWVLRPGELVPMIFLLDKVPRGFYVPLQAIRELNGAHSVFVVRDGVARRVPVTVHESLHELRRIEGEGLAEGDAIVVEGIHYVGDGDAVRVLGG